ncbi:MAG: hypothetical protein IJT75_03490 [Bacteroidaceae bacterium]|nr:hypothetical protein [Bacteroidaceae bacterium]
MSRGYIISCCLLVPVLAAAQLLHPHRHVPASPKLTPEVQRIRDSRRLFLPEHEMALPTSVDNSTSRYFPPLINQTGGSCAQASGIGYMFTYEMNRFLDRDASQPENRMSYLFAWNMINEGDNQGGFVEQGLQLAKNYGIMSEADYGNPSLYNFFWPTGYEKYVRAMHNRALDILTFNDSISFIKRYLYDAGCGQHPGGIVTFSTLAEGWNIDTDYQGPSETGYHALLTQLGTDGSHALTIVGYDDLVTYTDNQGTRHTGAFIICNTWGDYYYHDRGRYYLPYDFFRDEHVTNDELSNTMNAVRVTTYEPRAVLRVGLTYNQRNELRFGISSTQDRAASRPSVAPYNFYIMYHMGGPYPMQGQYKLRDIDIAFDASPRVPQDVTSVEQYFLHVTRQAQGNKKKGEGEVTAVEFIDLQTPAATRRWTYHGTLPAPINPGSNIFPIPLRPRHLFSASPHAWNATSTANGDPATFRLRTAHGRQAKFTATPSEDGQHLHIHYAITNKDEN